MATPIDLATRQQVYLERLKAGFERTWRQGPQIDLRDSARKMLTALEVDTMQGLTKSQLNALLARLGDAHVDIAMKGMLEFSDNLQPLSGFAAALEASTLTAFVVDTGLKFNAPTAEIAYQFARTYPVQATGQLLDPFIASWPEIDVKRIQGVVSTGWAQNKPLLTMVREVCGTRKNGYADGALAVSERNAGAIIATSTQHTANAARMKVFESNNDLIKGYTWISTLDRRTTPQCRSLDGRIFEAGKGPMPPLHIRCRSTTVAKLDKQFDFLDEGATRASGGPNPGPVSADETYYSWLKKQPASFQDVAIGPVRGTLLRNGGLTSDRFAALNLGRDFQPLTLREMQLLEPEAFKRAGILQSNRK